MEVGDVVKLKPRFHETGRFAIVLEVYRSECIGEGGWFSFEYIILSDTGEIHRVSPSVVEKVFPYF